MIEKVSLLNQTSVSVSSITYAIKAQNALRAMGIRCEIGRDERYYTGQGCGYTLTFRPGTNMAAVMEVLQRENIKLAPPAVG